MLWKVNGQDLEPISGATFADLKLKEQSLEDWIERKPELLGEPLLIIGRQVQVAGIDNRIDLLALDREGRLVVIEVKRDTADVPVDFQALRYVAAIAAWPYDAIKHQAESYYRDKDPDSDQQFQEIADSFFEEEPDLNEDQRIIIVGRKVHDRLVAVANWLINHSISVKIVEVTLFADGSDTMIVPSIVLPKDSARIGKAPTSPTLRPWDEGKRWHMEERCSPETAAMLEWLAEKIPVMVSIEGVSWNQKQYVVFRLQGRNWLAVVTRPTQLRLNFQVQTGAFSAENIARELHVAVFDHDASLAERLDTPSSVTIKHSSSHDRLALRIKPGFDLESEAFAKLIREAHKAAAS